MATHSSIHAWRILCTEEPGGLQSMGLQKVRLNLLTKQQEAHILWFLQPERVLLCPPLCLAEPRSC